MAQSSAKKLIKANSQRLKTLSQIIAVSNLIFAVIRLTLFLSTFTKFDAIIWLILILLYALPFLLLRVTARPIYNEQGTILSGGDDISAPGLLEYAHDLIYLTVFVQLAYIFSRWALLLFLVIPIYAVYLSCCSGGASVPDLASQMDDASDQFSSLSRKERRKADREARKQR